MIHNLTGQKNFFFFFNYKIQTDNWNFVLLKNGDKVKILRRNSITRVFELFPVDQY